MFIAISHSALRGHHLPLQTVHITTKVVNLNPPHGELYLIQHYVIKFVSVFFPCTLVSSTNKTDRHDIIEIHVCQKWH